MARPAKIQSPPGPSTPQIGSSLQEIRQMLESTMTPPSKCRFEAKTKDRETAPKKSHICHTIVSSDSIVLYAYH